MSRFDPLSMSLDQLISHRETQSTNHNNRKGGRSGPVSLAIKGSTSSNRRATRAGSAAAPYDSNHRGNASRNATNNGTSGNTFRAEVKHESAFKFLLSNTYAGILIGNGGSSVREMMDITDAAVHVSNHADYYPGTKERVIYITGPLAAVNLAQSLVWEMIGQQTDASDREGGIPTTVVTWEPSSAKNNPGQFDEVHVTGRISIPAAAGGLIVGRGGATIRSFSEESGVDSLTIDNKEDGEITQERVLTLSGSVAACMKCTSLILEKLQEGKNDLTHCYVCNGTGYAKVLRGTGNVPASNTFGSGGSVLGGYHGHGHDGHSVAGSSISPRARGNNYSNNNNAFDIDDDFSYSPRPSGRQVFASTGKFLLFFFYYWLSDFCRVLTDKGLFDPTVKTGVCAETLSAHTTIELAVPNAMIGSLLGVQGSTLNEIIGLSGAKVVVSKR